jgi:hypothetical protein
VDKVLIVRQDESAPELKGTPDEPLP